MRVLAGFLLFAFAGAAQAEPALLKAKGKDRTFYLFGTVHMLPKGEWMTPRIASRIAKADRVVLEVPPEDLQPVRASAALLKYGIDDDGVPLRQELPPKLRVSFEARLKELGAPPAAAFDPLRPWVTAVTVGALTLQSLGVSSENGAEQAIAAHAASARRAVVGLESVDEQMGFFGRFDRQTQYRFLDSSITDSREAAKEMPMLVKAWTEGDGKALGAYFDKARREDPATYKILLDDRNAAWVTRLSGPDYKGVSFVAVGAGHLAGPQGLVARLKAAGYKVGPVT